MSAQRELWSRREAGERSAIDHATKVAPSALAALVNEIEWMKPGARFTSETALARLSDTIRMCLDRAPNSVGAVISGLAKRGKIRKTGRYFPSSKETSRGRCIAEWERV